MEPTSIYHKNKRNLFVFIGLLILVTVGGIEIRSPANLSIFPFQVKNPGLVQHVLFIVSAYCFYQYYLAWFYQSDDVRSKIKYDFGVSIAAFLLAAAEYLFVQARPFIIQLNVTPTLAALVASGIGGLVGAAFGIWSFSELRKRRQQISKIRQETIKERLLTPGWVLVFNPQTRGHKAISFNSDGTIGEGQNNNEFRWVMDHDLLSIVRSNGTLQNKFRYDGETDQFNSLDDPLAAGIKGQFIFRSESSQPL